VTKYEEIGVETARRTPEKHRRKVDEDEKRLKEIFLHVFVLFSFFFLLLSLTKLTE
jgi:hypothetical protein